jgi:hypothetical protein
VDGGDGQVHGWTTKLNASAADGRSIDDAVTMLNSGERGRRHRRSGDDDARMAKATLAIVIP